MKTHTPKNFILISSIFFTAIFLLYAIYSYAGYDNVLRDSNYYFLISYGRFGISDLDYELNFGISRQMVVSRARGVDSGAVPGSSIGIYSKHLILYRKGAAQNFFIRRNDYCVIRSMPRPASLA